MLCRQAPDNIKAIYRKAKACQGLKQDQETVKLCERGLKLDPENKELKTMREKVGSYVCRGHCGREVVLVGVMTYHLPTYLHTYIHTYIQ